VDAVQIVIFGAIGGVIPDLLRIARAQGNLGQVGGANVLISMVVLAILGAVAGYVASLASSGDTTVLSSITAGFAGPEVISRLVGTSSGGVEAYAGGGRGVTGWWRV
jgi:hypothetical protein